MIFIMIIFKKTSRAVEMLLCIAIVFTKKYQRCAKNLISKMIYPKINACSAKRKNNKKSKNR